METLYDILQVSPNASKEVIDMAYKALAKKYHPDLNPSDDKHEAEEKMKALNAAYAVLKDAQTRAKYDSQLDFDNEANKKSDYTSQEQPERREERQSCQYITVEPHPWIRYFARCFDMYISTILIVILWVILSPTSYRAIFGKVPEYVAGITLYIIWIFIEAILLSVLGTTPGKWLLNAKVLDVYGRKLKFDTAVKRGFMVYSYGLWFLVPLVTIGGLVTSYNYLKRPNIYTGRSSWDVSCNSSVVVKKSSVWRVFLTICLIFTTLAAIQYYTNHINEKNQELVEMKQAIDDEAASLLAEEDTLNRMYEEFTDFESQMFQWQVKGDAEQFNAHYGEYENMIQEYNDRYYEYEARLGRHNENVDKYNALIGAE